MTKSSPSVIDREYYPTTGGLLEHFTNDRRPPVRNCVTCACYGKCPWVIHREGGTTIVNCLRFRPPGTVYPDKEQPA